MMPSQPVRQAPEEPGKQKIPIARDFLLFLSMFQNYSAAILCPWTERYIRIALVDCALARPDRIITAAICTVGTRTVAPSPIIFYLHSRGKHTAAIWITSRI